MGCCISKCEPKKTPKKEKQQEEEQTQCIEKNSNIPVVEDKLVISQAPTASPPKKSLISPPNAKAPSSTFFSCTNSNHPTTSSSSSSSLCSFLSSASSSSSSILSSELDRSGENENPHLIPHDYPVKAANSRTRSCVPTRGYVSGNKPNGPRKHPPSPQRLAKPSSQKRPRCSSPSSLARQKSFRREPDSRAIVSRSPSNLAHHQKSFRRELDRPVSRSSSRDLRPISPSPSRRYNCKGEAMTTSLRRENCYIRPHSPGSINSRRYGGAKNLVGKKDNQGIKGIGSKLEELAIGDLLSGQDMDWMPVEDANNPHIALDCFIFL